jgi:hypothetical protein
MLHYITFMVQHTHSNTPPSHDHIHDHTHPAAEPARPRQRRFSLLALSGLQRMLALMPLILILWAVTLSAVLEP